MKTKGLTPEEASVKHLNAALEAHEQRRKLDSQVVGTVTFSFFTIETAPKNRDIALWCPKRGRWLYGRWDAQEFHQKPRPYWKSWQAVAVDSDREDQPTHWAEILALFPVLPTAETQAPSTTSHQTGEE